MAFSCAVRLRAFCAGAASAQQQIAQPSRQATQVPGQERDTLRIARADAIAQALLRNPQLAVAREQMDEARAQRVQDVSIPDPVGTAAIEPQRGIPTTKPVGATIAVPFPDKFRLQYGIGTAGVRAAQATYEGLKQQIASQTAQTYDSLLVGLRHQADLTESLRLASEFLTKTQARYAAGTVAKLVHNCAGYAIQTALAHATCEVTVIHDADLEYHPRDLLRIVKVFVDEEADAVFGSRFAVFRRSPVSFQLRSLRTEARTTGTACEAMSTRG